MKNQAQNNNVAVVCDDLTEFFVIQPIIDRLIKQKIPVDIIIPYDSGYNGLAEHTIKKIKEYGYSPINDSPKNKTYKVLLTPYPSLEVVKRTDFIYQIQFPYGVASSKPTPTFLPPTRLDYNAILSFNTHEKDLLEAYGAKCYPVPYWRYHNIKRKSKTNKKPTLLILPTFGEDTSCVKQLTEESIQALRQNFYIITKSHHAIHFGLDGDEPIQKLKEIADESYDSDTPIDELMEKADIVLSDNSGAIFETICAEVPVALFSKDPNSRHLKNIDTYQYQLIQEGILPHTDNAEKILPLLLNIKPYYKKQLQLKKQIFPETTGDPYKPTLDIILQYLAKDESTDYRKTLHDILVTEWYDDKKKISGLIEENESLKQTVNNLLNSTSWRITKPLRKIGKMKRKDT